MTKEPIKDQKDLKDQDKKDVKQPMGQPDPETLGTTDPQEHMKGPISSLVHKAEKAVEKNDHGDDRENDEPKDKKED